ncbi:MAG: DUF3422 domain-containing protein [Hyphomicrobiales bacterium]
MDTEGRSGFLASFPEHPLRDTVLSEVHARPFPLLKAPIRAVHLAFTIDRDEAKALPAMVAEVYRSHGGEPPAPGARYHRTTIDCGTLRWEQHSEFTTFTWNSVPGEDPLAESVPDGPFSGAFRAPGKLLSAQRLVFIADPGEAGLTRLLSQFDQRSLSVSIVAQGRALLATDLQKDAEGFIRYLVVDRGMSEGRAGSVILRLHELETYRILALLGLPVALGMQPSVARMEAELGSITDAIRQSRDLAGNRELLARLTQLAGELEAEAASVSYRLSATHAYNEIVDIRLEALDEQALPGYGTLARFLARRMGPAMRTCRSIESRQAKLADKLAQAIDLLRARVDIDLEQQNGEVLASMNRRAQLQLRLQQTVEGLSIGAVSYYLLGIVGYAAKGLKEAGVLPVKPEVVVGLLVPVVLGLVYWMTQRIKKHHAEGGEH